MWQVLIILLLLGETSRGLTSTVPQCSKPPGLQQVAYSIPSTNKRVCLLSEVNLFANLSLDGARWPIGSVTVTPENGTTAACVYNNASIYVDQSALTGKGSITLQYDSGTAFALDYAPRGLYNTNTTVVTVAAGDPEPVEPLWLSYGISLWLVCELNGGQLRQPSFPITAFDDAPDCLVPQVVTHSTNVRVIRAVFNSSNVPIGNHSIVAIDGSNGKTCETVALQPPQPLITLIIVTPATSNKTTDTPSGTATVMAKFKISLIIGITVAGGVVFVLILVVLSVAVGIIIRKQNQVDQVKPVEGSHISLDLSHFNPVEGGEKPRPQEGGALTELGVETAKECAVKMHCTQAGSNRPTPLSLLSDILDDRSQSTTPPDSATHLLGDSGVSSLTNSGQPTPEVQHRGQYANNVSRDQQSLLVSVLMSRTHDMLKEIKNNTDILVDETQKDSLGGSEHL